MAQEPDRGAQPFSPKQLTAVRERWMRTTPFDPTAPDVSPTLTVRRLLATVDTQDARLMAVEQALAAAERERDAARADKDEQWQYAGRWLAEAREARIAAEQRATRLESLEAAARAWSVDGSAKADDALLDAIAALDGGAGEAG